MCAHAPHPSGQLHDHVFPFPRLCSGQRPVSPFPCRGGYGLSTLVTKLAPAVQAVIPRLSPGTFRLLTSLLRTFNNILGGVSFVTLARLTGVQAAGGNEPQEPTA